MVFPMPWSDIFCKRLKKLSAYPFIEKMVKEGEATLWIGMGYGSKPPLFVTLISTFNDVREFVFAAIEGKGALKELPFFVELAKASDCNYMVGHSRSLSRTKMLKKIGFVEDEVLLVRTF